MNWIAKKIAYRINPYAIRFREWSKGKLWIQIPLWIFVLWFMGVFNPYWCVYPVCWIVSMEIGQLISDFGFPIVMAVGMGYFVYFVYQTILTKVDPAVDQMKITIIRLIDQLRLLDQDMIRLQEKVNTVLEMKENEKKLQNNDTTVGDGIPSTDSSKSK